MTCVFNCLLGEGEVITRLIRADRVKALTLIALLGDSPGEWLSSALGKT